MLHTVRSLWNWTVEYVQGLWLATASNVGALVPAEVQERITYWWPQALMPARTQTVLGDKAAVVFPVILLLAVGGVCCVCLCRVCRCFCPCRRNRKGGRDAHDHHSEAAKPGLLVRLWHRLRCLWCWLFHRPNKGRAHDPRLKEKDHCKGSITKASMKSKIPDQLDDDNEDIDTPRPDDDTEELKKKPWYFEGSFEEANLKMKEAKKKEDGTYLVCNNPDRKGSYVMLVYYQGEIKKMEISRKPAKFVYVLGEGAKTHDTVRQLIKHHRGVTGKPIQLGDGNKVILFDYIKQPKGSVELTRIS